MNEPIHKVTDRATLDKMCQAEGAPHLKILWETARDYGIAILFVHQEKPPTRFGMPKLDRPTVFYLGDDYDCSMGPDGFDAGFLKQLVRKIGGVVVVSCGPLPELYATAVINAIMGKHVALIETRPDHEIQWIEYVRSARGEDFPILVGTVRENPQ